MAVAEAAAPPAAVLAGTRGPPRQGLRAPSRTGSSPDSGWPLLKNLVLASKVTIGLVNRKTTTTSMTVVSPRVNAKPFTSPIAK